MRMQTCRQIELLQMLGVGYFTFYSYFRLQYYVNLVIQSSKRVYWYSRILHSAFCPATHRCLLITSNHDVWTTTPGFWDVTQVGWPSMKHWRSSRSTLPSMSRSTAGTPITDPSTGHQFQVALPPRSTSTTPTEIGDWDLTTPGRRQRLEGSMTPLWGLSSSSEHGRYITS